MNKKVVCYQLAWRWYSGSYPSPADDIYLSRFNERDESGLSIEIVKF